MVYEMDVAGVLNSMPDEDLIATCKRLQRSVEDMTTLCNEFEQEQEMLLREQDRLHSRIEKVLSQMGANKKQEDLGIISSFLNQVDKTLEVSNIFKAKAQRQAAKKKKSQAARVIPADCQEDDEQENGPFSDASLQKSWGCDIILGALRQDAKKTELVIMERWVREALCAESVAEADSVDMWMAKAQLVSACVAHDDLDSMRPVGVTNSALRNSILHQGITPIAEGSDDAEFAESPSEIEEDAFSRELAQPNLSRMSTNSRQNEVDGRRASFASTFRRVTGLFGDLTGAGNSVNDCTEVFSLTVVLRRNTAEEKWGLGWREEDMKASEARVFKFSVKDSKADIWNKEKKDDGHEEQCIQPMDRLVSVNGKTLPADIRAELTGPRLEVVLEFHRTVATAPVSGPNAVADVDAPDSSRGLGIDVNAEASTKAPRSPARQKPSFSKAFSAYLEDQGVAVPTLTPSPDAFVSPIAEQDETLEVQSRSKESQKLMDLDSLEIGDEVPVSGPPSDIPHSIVVQVLSRSGGSVRLSWSFDWAASPDALRDEPWVARCFEVLEDEDDKGRTWITARSFARFDLPVGHRYTLKVRALLLDTRKSSSSSTALLGDASDSRYSDSSLTPSTESSAAAEASWASLPSSAAAVDLRSSSTSSPEKKLDQRGEVADGEDQEKPVLRLNSKRERGTVAAGLGSFLAQTPSSPSLRRTTSARVSSTLPTTPEIQKTISSPSIVSSDAAADVDAGIQNPLNLSAPRVVANTPMSADEEKREIAERLRIRRGGPLVALDAPSTAPRSCSIDDDDGSLQQLASALRTLHTHTNIKEAVAEEGHHGLSDRLESSPLKNKSKSSDSVPELRFQLAVQLADGKAETLEFSSSTNTLELMREFVLRNRLREDLLLQPLNERAESMVRSARLEDAVDIIDLL